MHHPQTVHGHNLLLCLWDIDEKGKILNKPCGSALIPKSQIVPAVKGFDYTPEPWRPG